MTLATNDRGKKLRAIVVMLQRMTEADLDRVTQFAEAIDTQKRGKRSARQKRHNNHNNNGA